MIKCPTTPGELKQRRKELEDVFRLKPKIEPEIDIHQLCFDYDDYKKIYKKDLKKIAKEEHLMGKGGFSIVVEFQLYDQEFRALKQSTFEKNDKSSLKHLIREVKYLTKFKKNPYIVDLDLCVIDTQV